jgi:ribosome-associated protein
MRSPTAAPRATKPRARKATGSDTSGELKDLIVKALDDGKGEHIVTLDLVGRTSLCDYMVIASGRSNRHVAALAEQVVEDLKKSGRRGVRIEGLPQADWVLVDAGDVILHVFRPEVRDFYNLEKMWSGERPSADTASE